MPSPLHRTCFLQSLNSPPARIFLPQNYRVVYRDGRRVTERGAATHARRATLHGVLVLHVALSMGLASKGQNHIVLVTGANRGLGLEIARGFGSLGHQVVLTSRDQVVGTRAMHDLQAEGLDVMYRELDLASKSSIGALVASCTAGDIPTPTILVNNGAVCLEGGSRDILDRSLAINYHGTRYLTERLMPLLRARRQREDEENACCVVNVSSGDGELAMLCSELQQALTGTRTLHQLDAVTDQLLDKMLLTNQELAFGTTPAYSVSKALLNAFSRILGEASERVRVIAVCPGDVSTRMCSDLESAILQSPQEAAQDVIWTALSAAECPSGRFFRHRHLIPW